MERYLAYLFLVLALASASLAACSEGSENPVGACQACADATIDAELPVPPMPDAGGMDGGDTPIDSGSERDAGDGTDGASDAAIDGGELSFPTGPIRPTRYRLADPAYASPPCSASGDGTLSEHTALIGQTHLTPAGWPFQPVSANRPLTIAVSAAVQARCRR